MTETITTVSGKFYAGMTRAEAEEQGVAKKSGWIRFNEKLDLFNLHTARYSRFDDIDLNADGVLQDTEICFQRDSEASENSTRKKGALLLGIVAACAAPALVVNPFTAIMVGASALAGIGYGLLAKDGSEARKETEKYRQEHIYSSQVA